MLNFVFSILFFSILTICLTMALTRHFKWDVAEILKFLAAAVTFIIFLTVLLFPLPLSQEEAGFASVNIIPFKTIAGYIISAVRDGMVGTALFQILGNVLLFFFFMSVLGWYMHLYSFRIYVIWLLIFAVMAEGMQAVVSLCLGYLYRSVDIDDVILYVIGGLLSYAWLGRYAKENNTSHKE